MADPKDDEHEDEPQVGNDPMDLPQDGKHKKMVAPDPAKVAEAERKRAHHRETPEEEAERIKNS